MKVAFNRPFQNQATQKTQIALNSLIASELTTLNRSGKKPYTPLLNGASVHKLLKCLVRLIAKQHLTQDDMKILECFQSMHQYLTFQTEISALPIQEKDKLLKFSQFCEGMQSSLQFREDLVNAMALNMDMAETMCNYTMNSGRNDSRISQWWWDNKRINSDAVTCTALIDSIEEEQEYGIVTNVATDLALDSFIHQLKNKVISICDQYTIQVFRRQCSKRILDSGLMFLLEDDQLEKICSSVSDIQSCAQTGPILVNGYYATALKGQLVEYGRLTVNNYFNEALSKIENLIKEQIAKQTVSNQQQDDTTNESIPNDSKNQDKNDISSDTTDNSTSQETTDQSNQLVQTNRIVNTITQNEKSKQEIDNRWDDLYDNDDDEEFNSVPLDIPI